MKSYISGSLIVFIGLSGCKEDDDNDCEKGRQAIYIGAVIDGAHVQAIVGLPEGHYGLIYLDPSGGAVAVVAMSGSVDLGEFEPGTYEIRLIVYMAGAYDNDLCNYPGEIYGTSFSVPEES